MKPLSEEARAALRILERCYGEGSEIPVLRELMTLTGLSAEELGGAFYELLSSGILDYRPWGGYRIVDPV